MYIDINKDGGGTPDSTVWQECNGSEIVNPISPLRTIGLNQNFVPDLRSTYLRAALTTVGNTIAGSQDHNLSHSHTTGGASAIGGGMEDKGDRRHRVAHGHNVATQYNNPTVFDSPAFLHMIAYMKVI